MADEIWTSIGIDYPVSREEIAAVARKMIELHGKAAPIEASERCNKALRAEDTDTYDLWQAITGTISQIMFPAFMSVPTNSQSDDLMNLMSGQQQSR